MPSQSAIRWLHLSDFHTGADAYGQSTLFKFIHEDVKGKVQAGQAPDVVFITGDIAHAGKENQYQTFNIQFLNPLIDILPPEVMERIFLIPGNHDVDRSEARAIPAYDTLRRLERFLDPNNEGLNLRRDLLRRFRAYSASDVTDFTMSGSEHWLFSPQGVYTRKLEIRGHTLGILGINTAWFCEGEGDRFQLTPGEEMIREGLEAIKDCEIRIVLGHHPIDWFIESDVNPIRSLFSKYHVLYLHGHLHENVFRPEIDAWGGFLAVEAGASFQAREHDRWVNSFLWCELDLGRQVLRLEPKHWSRGNQEWQIYSPTFPNRLQATTDKGELLAYWEVPLPGSQKEQRPAPRKDVWKPPPGWDHITRQFLEKYAKEPDDAQLLRFFDGKLPDWQIALSDRVRPRQRVGEIAQTLEETRQAGRPRVTLLLGAAGEGKSTILMQAICSLIKADPTWHVWWNTDRVATPDTLVEAVKRLPESEEALIIASDEADLVAPQVFEAVKLLQRQGRRNVQFLLSCQSLGWSEVQEDFQTLGRDILVKEELQGLSEPDARVIVEAWHGCGKNGEGLGKLQGIPLEQAAHQLYEEARSLGTPEDGAFFGAMLAVRYGEELQNHVEEVLHRLERREAGGRKLLQALAYIAAVHILNGEVRLSQDMLARLLEYKRKELWERVFIQLGNEAVIAFTSGCVYTRHKEIAKATLRLLSEQSNFELEEIYAELVQAARNTYLADPYRQPPVVLPDISNWNKLSSWFFYSGIPRFLDKEGNKRIGLRVAQALIDVEPTNPYFYIQMANLIRKDGHPDTSVKTLRDAFKKVNVDRGYYYEWATAEGQAGNHHIGAWLSGLSLADASSNENVDTIRARQSLAGLAIALGELFDKYHDSVFIKASAGAVQLGLTLSLNEATRRSLEHSRRKCQAAGAKDVTLPLALANLHLGISAAYKLGKDEIHLDVLPGDGLTFFKLARLLNVSPPG